MERVVICRIMKEGAAWIVIGKGVIKGLVEIKRSVQALALTFKSHT